ncbi:MAG: hypothetical protein ABIS92_11565 [Polyangia bacterium]
MRWHAVAPVVPTALLAAIIAAIPVARAQGNVPPPDSATSPASPAPVHAPARLVEVAPDSPQPPPAPRMVASLSHELQFGLSVLLGDGYRGIFPYDDLIDCGDAKANDSRVCTNRAPVFIDLQPSFGLSRRWDFLVDLRFGLTRDFNTYHQFFVMPGFRYWIDPQSQVKFFSTLQLAYDRSRQNNRPGAPHVVSDTDIGFRNSNGLMVEVMRNLGIFFQFGETVGFYRWLSFTVDAGIGVQARVP